MSILITKEEFLEKMNNGEIEELLNSNDHIVIGKIYKFRNKIYWCNFRKGLYIGSNDIEINITKIQKRIIEILIKNPDKLLTTDEIIKFAWKGKSVDIATFRNMIKHIRDKTYYDLITNRSNIGYGIGTFEDKKKKEIAIVKNEEPENKLTLELLSEQIKELQKDIKIMKRNN